MKKMICLVTSIGFLSIQPFMRPLFSGQQELSNLDYFFQNDGKTDAQTNQSFWKLNKIFWWSKISHIIIKGYNFIIKSFSGQVVFCFAILRAITAYVGENWLSQYIYIYLFLYIKSHLIVIHTAKLNDLPIIGMVQAQGCRCPWKKSLRGV